MATVFFDDFDSGAALSPKWALVESNIHLVPGAGLGGTTACGSDIAPYNSPWLIAEVAPSPADIIKFRWYQWIPAGSLPFTGFSTYVVAAIYYANGSAYAFANRQVSVNTTDDGKFYFRRGSYDGTDIAGPTTDPVWVEDTWNEIEIEIKVHDTTGYIILKKGGVEVLNATGLDTKALSTAAIDGVEIIPQSSGGTDAVIDSVRMMDTSATTPLIGCATFGTKARVVGVSRAIAIALDDLPHDLTDAGKFAVWGDVDVDNGTTRFLDQYGSPTIDAGNSSTAKTLDWQNGNTQLLTLTGTPCVLTLSNPKDGYRYLLALKQDGTGSRTVTWPSSVKWQAGTAPTLSTTAGKVDIVTLVWFSGLGASGNYLAAANTDYTPA